MQKQDLEWAKDRSEVVIGNLLRAGVITAASIVIFGAIIYLFAPRGNFPNYRVFQGEPIELRQVVGIVRCALSFDARGLIQLGLLVLIMTPIARVVLCLLIFLVKRDRLYVIVTCFVLIILCYSLFRG